MTEVWPHEDDDDGLLEPLGRNRRKHGREPQPPIPTPDELPALTEKLRKKAEEEGKKDKGDEL